jgi:hypothetical protein
MPAHAVAGGADVRAPDLLARLQRDSVRGRPQSPQYDALTRQRYLAVMKQVDPATRQLMQQNLAQVDASHAEYMPRLPTPHQSVEDYARLERAKERLDVTLSGGGGIPPRTNVVIGTVETEHLNALSTRCDEPAEYLIVFNRALLTGFLRLCNYLTCALTPGRGPGRADVAGSGGDTMPVEDIDDEAVSRLAPLYRELLEAVTDARMPDPRNTFAFLWDAEDAEYRNLRWQLMEDFVTDFVFAHEYAHVFLDHLRRSDEPEPSEDHGGWGHEYEADSVGLELLVHTWMNKVRGDARAVTWLLQSVGLVFIFTSQVERYAAEVRGATGGVWRDSRTHPPTWVRYGRLLGEISRYPYLPWPAIHPHLRRVEDCLELIYGTAVGGDVARSASSLEWRFQRVAFESLGPGLLPQHLFVAARAVKLTLDSGATPDQRQLEGCMAHANRELNAHGVYPLADVTRPLVEVVSLLGNHALEYARSLGPTTVRGFADELALVALRDARTRYPNASRR